MSKASGAADLLFFFLTCPYLFKNIYIIEVPVLSILCTLAIAQESTLVKFSYVVRCRENAVLAVV